MWWTNGTIIVACAMMLIASCGRVVAGLVRHDERLRFFVWDVMGWALLLGSLFAFTGLWRVRDVSSLLLDSMELTGALAGISILVWSYEWQKALKQSSPPNDPDVT